MKRLLSRLGLFDVVWSAGCKNDILLGNKPYKNFIGWRIVRFNKLNNRTYIYVSRCIDLKLYLDDKPQINDHYVWFPDRPKKCTCCTVHGAAK